MSKEEISARLEGILKPRAVELWWELKLPGLGMATPNEVWEKDPQKLRDYVEAYFDMSSA